MMWILMIGGLPLYCLRLIGFIWNRARLFIMFQVGALISFFSLFILKMTVFAHCLVNLSSNILYSNC